MVALTPPGRANVLSDQAWQIVTTRLHLSARQADILRLILQDSKSRAIASQLGISVHTVRTQIERIYTKLDVHNQMQLAMRVIDTFFAATCEPTSPLSPLCARNTAGLCPMCPSCA